MIQIKTLDDLAAKAAEMEMEGARFLNRKGEIARKKRFVTHGEFTFIDGVKIVVDRATMDRPEFDELKFRLRPSVNQS